jgi:putative CocE/NonD family hydrolase
VRLGAVYVSLGTRPDVLVFRTELLCEPSEVTGSIEVHLWVATSAVDTDFTAKLIDVYPPSAWYPQGYALNLTDSIARLRYRNGRERGELVKAGEPVPVTLTLYPTSNLFMPRHRIRLDVSTSNFPRFDVNPNTGEAIGRERRRMVADNTVFHERGRESRMASGRNRRPWPPPRARLGTPSKNPRIIHEKNVMCTARIEVETALLGCLDMV